MSADNLQIFTSVGIPGTRGKKIITLLLSLISKIMNSYFKAKRKPVPRTKKRI